MLFRLFVAESHNVQFVISKFTENADLKIGGRFLRAWQQEEVLYWDSLLIILLPPGAEADVVSGGPRHVLRPSQGNPPTKKP